MNLRKTILAQFSVPLLLAAGAFVHALLREGFGFEILATQLLGTALFFAAPHLLWLASASALCFIGTAWHSGFVAASLVLAFVAISPMFHAGDPSGLPYQWLLYWPLAIAVQFAITVVALLRRRFHHA